MGSKTVVHRTGGKSAAWFTAFYCLAEHIREASCGELNNKRLYALIGTEEHYINHSNPVVRKRTAGTLSRIIHTKRYVQDMREAYSQDAAVFDCAAESICSSVSAAQGESGLSPSSQIRDEWWPDVRQGLINESSEWRADFDLYRLDCEMDLLFSSNELEGEAGKGPEALLSAMLYVMAFGHLEVSRARALVDGFAPEAIPRYGCSGAEVESACLIRFAGPGQSSVSGFWVIPRDMPFAIGRYTDCQAIELSPAVLGVQHRISREGDGWRLADADGGVGAEVLRGGTCVRRPHGGSSSDCVKLEFGDTIKVPGGSTYLFAKVDECCQMPFSFEAKS